MDTMGPVDDVPGFKRRIIGYDPAAVDAHVHASMLREVAAEAEQRRLAGELAEWHARSIAWDLERATWSTECEGLRAQLAEADRLRTQAARMAELVEAASDRIAQLEGEAAERARQLVADAEAHAAELAATAEHAATERMTAALVEFECIDSVRSHASAELDELARILANAKSMLESIPIPRRDTAAPAIQRLSATA